MSLAKQLKQARVDAGLTQVEVAKAIDTDQANISRWERGLFRPSDAMIEKLARLYRVDPAQIVFGKPSTTDLFLRSDLPFASVIGTVEAGAWREQASMDSSVGELQFVPHKRFPAEAQVAFAVSGDSCNKVVASGGYVIAVPYEAFPGGIDVLLTLPTPLIIAERERAGVYEYTMKKLAMQNGTLELQPVSTSPKHQDAVRLDEGEIRIAYVVIQAIHNII